MQICGQDGKSWGACQGCKVVKDGGSDGAVVDAPQMDKATTDQAMPDTLKPDAPLPDKDVPDQTVPDTSIPDVLIPDKAMPDQLVPDAAMPDAPWTPPGTWVTIPAGKFMMGSPDGTGTQPKELCRVTNEDQHQVTLTNKFEIQSTEVSQDQFLSVMGYNPSKFKSCGGTCPVEKVSWHEAASYCNALSKKVGLVPCYNCYGVGTLSVTCAEYISFIGSKIYSCPGYRLPTEAEWEYSYRAGTTTAFYNGAVTVCNGIDPNASKIGWYNTIAGGSTHPVGKKDPNSWGLYDMAGNVPEWCHDPFQIKLGSTAVTNPVGSSSMYRVQRISAWKRTPAHMRAANRLGMDPHDRNEEAGFRCVRTK